MRMSRLPAGGSNVFQQIRIHRAEAEAGGVALLDLSIGEPKGAALTSAREAASRAVMSEDEAMHAYQYNDSHAVPGFSKRFVRAHLAQDLPNGEIDYLPIPGIKPILGLLPLACGCAGEDVIVATTAPGYPIPANWCAYHPRVDHRVVPLTSANSFRFSASDIPEGAGLLMMNYPHNPSGQIAELDWITEICTHCAEHDIRLFNDAAYVGLSHDRGSVTLSHVAPHYPELSWAEAFTAAKLIGNGTGWHVGAMVGSSDFIADIKEVKGKTDAGFVAPMAAGVLAALENDQKSIAGYVEMYHKRLGILKDVMVTAGMRLAIEPRAGFYTLWEAPARAFGETISSAAEFNFRMIERTGVVGVHFGTYLRYAVCADVATIRDSLADAFHTAAVSYD